MSFLVKLRCGNDEITKEYDNEILLSDVISASGFTFDMPCGGRGVCGNCRVLVKGSISAPSKEEVVFLGDRSKNGERLACFTKVFGDTEVVIPKLGFLNEVSNQYISQINPITGDKKCFACAIDVGTTTIVFRYYSLPDSIILHQESVANPQRTFGLDVLTRIQYASSGNGLFELKTLIETEIEKSVLRFGKDVEFFIISGNTAMLHILSGNNPSGLATAPFTPNTLFGFWDKNRYYMPCVSAYIGGDVIASVIASRMLESKNVSALLDIGTNNECVLFDGNRILACSSPAGPAFEGGNISCGCALKDGAIFKVDDIDGTPRVHTFGNNNPIGFCGSGLIDAIAFLLNNGYIEKDGSVKKELPDFDGITLTPEDIAELQLAKSAVCAGLLTLCDYANVFPEKIYLSGSFGNRIDAINAETIGLLPKKSAEITCVSPSAIDGASALLLDKKLIGSAEKIAKEIEVVELADSEFFQKAFIENMFF